MQGCIHQTAAPIEQAKTRLMIYIFWRVLCNHGQCYLRKELSCIICLFFFFPYDQATFYDHRQFEEGSFDWKLKVLRPFLRLESDQTATKPPPTSFLATLAPLASKEGPP